MKEHEELQVSECGLFVDLDRPFLGASPHGIVSCKFCGKSVLEVKCPLCIKHGLPEPEEMPRTFCISEKDGKYTLKKDHAYYFQVQMQLALCKLLFCEFIVWTDDNFIVERISVDIDFFTSKLPGLQQFFAYAILPDVVGKWYTRKPVANIEGIVP